MQHVTVSYVSYCSYVSIATIYDKTLTSQDFGL